MNEIVVAAALGTVITAAILAAYRWEQRHEILMVQRWAEKNRMKLLHLRARRLLEPAPFSFWTSHMTPNYFVGVRDQQGKERSGWVRLGTIFEGTHWGGKDKVEVRWEET